jgi:endonuclease/exonuclease/phosphatase family metal-dependent hydrolase
MATSMTQLADNVQTAFAQFQANDFHTRAESIADRIKEENPSVVGLQEVVSVFTQPSGDRFTGGDQPAENLVIDFQQVLMDALTARGLNYTVAVTGETADVELPSASGEDIRLVDHNIILVRNGIGFSQPEAHTFEARLPIPTPDGKAIDFTRGFVALIVNLRGNRVLVVNAHLEVSAFGAVQEAQAAEMLAFIAPMSEPVILMGDFNSAAPPLKTTGTYDLIANRGFQDAWDLRADPAMSGFTCCQDADLLNPTSLLSERIDIIWLLGQLPAVTPDVHVVGALEVDKTSNGLWPSDHGGVTAEFAR